MFINFIIYFLHLERIDGPNLYLPWYSGAGSILGILIPFVCSLLFVLLFYYAWSKVKATTTVHWLLMGIFNLIVTFFLTLFIGKSALANYIDKMLGDEGSSIYYYVSTWPFSTDIWFFALNAVIWSLIFYFLLSVILKRWSPVWNIPFGKKYKKSVN